MAEPKAFEFLVRCEPTEQCNRLGEISFRTEFVKEFVRCKDCRFLSDAKRDELGFMICPESGMIVADDRYCSYGSAR